MKVLMPLLAMAIGLCSKEIESPILTGKNHRTFVEPDFGWNISYTYQDKGSTITEWGRFFGINLGYEYVRPNYLYYSIRFSDSIGNRFAKQRTAENEIQKSQHEMKKTKYDLRVGHGFTTKYASLTPYAGLGGYTFKHEYNKSNALFIPVGFNLDFKFPYFSIGIKAEQTHFVYIWEFSQGELYSTNVWGPYSYGYEISVPLTFDIGFINDSKLSCSVEPYYNKMTDNFSLAGGRLSITSQY